MCLTGLPIPMQSESDGRGSSTIGSGFEVLLALATLTLWPILDERAVGSPAQRARALVFTPIIGFFAGVVLGLIDHALRMRFTVGTRSWAVVIAAALAMLFLQWRGIADLFEALRAGVRPASTGLARIGPGGVAVAMTAFALEVLLLSRIREPASRTAALVMSSMLARWSIVPVAYGLKAGERWGLGLPFEGGIEFREFAISSVIALGLTLALYADVGLVVTVVVALVILGLRFLFSRRFGGVPGFALAGASAIIELAVIMTVATLAT
jgi:cobalamin synthase